MLPDEETIDWIFDATAWWIKSFGGLASLAETTLAMPTPAHFPIDARQRPRQLADQYLGCVQALSGTQSWPFEVDLHQGPNVAEILRGVPHGMTSAPTGGVRRAPLAEGDPLPIPLDPARLQDAESAIAGLARGVAHYVLQGSALPRPVEDEDLEYLVDLGAVLLGFGVFVANASFRFSQSQEGLMSRWGVSRNGALSELDLAYALALFVVLVEQPERPVRKALRSNPSAFFKDAHKHIRRKRKDDLTMLRGISHGSDGPYR